MFLNRLNLNSDSLYENSFNCLTEEVESIQIINTNNNLDIGIWSKDYTKEDYYNSFMSLNDSLIMENKCTHLMQISSNFTIYNLSLLTHVYYISVNDLKINTFNISNNNISLGIQFKIDKIFLDKKIEDYESINQNQNTNLYDYFNKIYEDAIFMENAIQINNYNDALLYIILYKRDGKALTNLVGNYFYVTPVIVNEWFTIIESARIESNIKKQTIKPI